ncbi:serine/threonine-protein kinase [Gordonia sp. NPDC003424]
MPGADDRSGTRVGDYDLIELIGRGGMGQVYRAKDTRRDRIVALKLLNPGLAGDSGFRSRFMRESQTAARLTDPHVIPIHDWGEVDGLLFIDMRLVEGRNLRELIDRDGPLTQGRALNILQQVGDALDSAHAHGLVHRDVKPDNIIVDRNDFAYLVDFGLAQGVTDPRLTTAGAAIGSMAYMAPERFGPNPEGPASDIYSLTCVLYEMLSGRQPFHATSVEQLIAAQLHAPAPTLPSPLDRVIHRGLSKDPTLRYRSARDLITDAQSVAAGRPAPTVRTPDEQWATTQIAVPRTGTSVDEAHQIVRGPRSGISLPVVVVLVALAVALAGVGWWLIGRPSTSETDSSARQVATDTTREQAVISTATQTVTSTVPPGTTGTAGTTTEAPTVTAPARGSGDLGLSTPISRPACDGTGIVVVGNATSPATYATEIAALLARYPGSSYLRTDQSCPSLRQSLDGYPIYAVYLVAGQSEADVCALRARVGGDAYGKWLDTTSSPTHQISCG